MSVLPGWPAGWLTAKLMLRPSWLNTGMVAGAGPAAAAGAAAAAPPNKPANGSCTSKTSKEQSQRSCAILALRVLYCHRPYRSTWQGERTRTLQLSHNRASKLQAVQTQPLHSALQPGTHCGSSRGWCWCWCRRITQHAQHVHSCCWCCCCGRCWCWWCRAQQVLQASNSRCCCCTPQPQHIIQGGAGSCRCSTAG